MEIRIQIFRLVGTLNEPVQNNFSLIIPGNSESSPDFRRHDLQFFFVKLEVGVCWKNTQNSHNVLSSSISVLSNWNCDHPFKIKGFCLLPRLENVFALSGPDEIGRAHV